MLKRTDYQTLASFGSSLIRNACDELLSRTSDRLPFLGALETRGVEYVRRAKLKHSSFAELNALSQPGPDLELSTRFSQTGYCFIHIPKNGGTSIENLLYQSKVGHRPWHELYSLSPAEYEKWFKLCVIREPIDRFLSSYDYLKKGGRNEIDDEMGRRYIADRDINDFITQFEIPKIRRDLLTYFHFRPQADFVLSEDRLCMVDKMIPFDRLSRHIAELLQIDESRVGHSNKTRGSRTTPSQLNDSSRRILEALYQMDFELYRCARSAINPVYRKTITVHGSAPKPTEWA